MKLLLTGASGFIGQHLLNDLNDVIRFDKSSGNKNILDVTLLDDVITASKGCNGIIHMAAISRVSDCENDPKKCIDVNVNGTLNILDAAVKNNLEWIGLVSSGEVQWIENNEVQSFKKINNIYGISKLACEMLVDVIGNKSGLKSTIYRISSVVFGENDNPDKVLPLFVTKSINGDDIRINDASYEWDFIHVDEVVNVIKKSIYDKKESEDYIKEINIFSGIRLDLLSLAKIISYLSSSTSKIYLIDSLVDKVTSSEFNKIVKQRKISDEFLSKVSDLISSKLLSIKK
jgi:nucleoside-diphosphate-sugar epimerase